MGMKRAPLVSVVTVVYNAGHKLGVTLESVLSQKNIRAEVVVVDGMSTDPETVKTLKRYRKRINVLVREPDKGIYDAMNKGLREASGEFVMFLNCGDTFSSTGVLAAIAPALQDSVDVLYGDVFLVDESGEELKLLRAKSFRKRSLAVWGTRVACHQAMFVRRTIAAPYSMRYRLKAELDWYFDLVARTDPSRFVHLDRPVVRYLVGGMTHQHQSENARERVHVIMRRAGIGWLIAAAPLLIATRVLNARFRTKRGTPSENRRQTLPPRDAGHPLRRAE
jgi:glycosyltransferase involved in cell wall biosynthesis